MEGKRFPLEKLVESFQGALLFVDISGEIMLD
jgi:hypothetical protein